LGPPVNTCIYTVNGLQFAMETLELAALSPYENFVYALKAKESKRQYPHRLDKFLSFLGLKGSIQEKCNKLYAVTKDKDMLEPNLIRFINFQKERIEKKDISEGTLRNYVKAIKLFCSMNDIMLNWKKISKGLPHEKSYAEDRIPSVQEIHRLLEHADRRIKPVVLTMLSSGIRVGSWDYLQWKHVIPVKRDGIIIAAKLIVKNTKINNRTYYTFITPEAYHSVKDWMDFRKMHGEDVTEDSFLIRDTWQKIDRKHGHTIGLAKFPKKISSLSIRNMIYEAWKVQGIRSKLSDPKNKRHEFKSTHSFRKLFETKCQNAKMNHNNIKLLMDHSLGESQNYHRPTVEELLEDYLNALDLLTINEENRLRGKVQKLEVEKSRIDEITLQLEEIKAEMKNRKMR
jgi:hypothetical protein